MRVSVIILWWAFLVSSVASAFDTITIADYSDRTVFQRNLSTYNCSITVSGTYTGAAEAVDARVVDHGTSTEVVAWTQIVATPTGGTFSGTLSGVPQGGWYNVQVRGHTNTGVTSNGTHKFGVGIHVLAIGQSNMAFGCNSDNTPAYSGTDTPNEHTAQYNWSSWKENAGNLAVAVANALNDEHGIPVAILNFAYSGSALGYRGTHARADAVGWWLNDAANPYLQMYNKVIELCPGTSGSRQLELIMWDQGESDAWDSNGAYYDTDLQTLYGRLQALIRSNVPFFLAQIGRDDGFSTDAGWNTTQLAAFSTATNTAGMRFAASTYDLPGRLDGTRLHRGPDGLRTEGQRIAQAMLHYYGAVSYSRGPRILGFKRISATELDVYIAHNGGTSFTPTSGITGFTVLNDGTPVTVNSAAMQDYQTIRLTTASTSWGTTVTVRYMYGNNPTITGAVKDNSAMALPLEKIVTTVEISAPQEGAEPMQNITISGGGAK
jgi:hypothetical protein